MAATACAYGYQGTRPLAPARSSPADPFLVHFDDEAEAVTPPPPRQARAPPSFASRHIGICTEGLGSESSGDVDLSDLSDDVNGGEDAGAEVRQPCKRQHRDDGDEEEEEPPGRARRGGRSPALFPPPISVIGAGGKPWLYLRHHREGGRLVLREVKIPSRELLQGRREGGRFKLQFAQPQPEEEEQVGVGHHQCQDQPPDAVARQEGNG
ncbi:hypothetical protein HU200_038702 [Digitaria exilis]|uniref:FAF domain-containing protein n=1 Tax=Digitaria exilis TaxID=1010633 RepID=A0A835B920_9POAL|nr:hypothetical protein HU200_038702 [Digitaria exilis]CAB3449941.1 unnamed protein product [Digitaria exilis]